MDYFEINNQLFDKLAIWECHEQEFWQTNEVYALPRLLKDWYVYFSEELCDLVFLDGKNKKNRLANVDHECAALANAYNEAVRGNHIKALEYIRLYTKHRIENVYNKNGLSVVNAGKVFFRGRVSDFVLDSPDQLKHISFEERGKIRSTRYGTVGMPILYVSQNIYTVWNELGRPSLERFFVSGLMSKKDINVFPVETSGSLIKLKLWDRSDEEQLYEKLAVGVLYLPLGLTCTIKRKNNIDSWFPEYTVPQLLVSSIVGNANTKIDAIRFPSTWSNSSWGQLDHYNYVFPIPDIALKGHSAHLDAMFDVSHPITYPTMKMVDSKIIYSYYRSELIQGPKFSLLPDSESYYNNSSFGELESYIQRKFRSQKI